MTDQLKDLLKGGLYAFISFFFFLLAKILFRLRVKGKEIIDHDSHYITVARHRSYWDILLLVVALGWRNRIHFIARKGLLRNPLFNALIKLYATAIDRDNFNKADFRRMLQAIKRERLIGIFPEGTTRRRVDPKSGAIHFARLTGKKFLPVNIRANGPYPPRYPFRYPQITISFGQPFTVSELESETVKMASRAERYRLLSERLMEQIDAV